MCEGVKLIRLEIILIFAKNKKKCKNVLCV